MTVNTETALQANETEVQPKPVPRETPVRWSAPAADVFEGKDDLLLTLDMPGVPKDALEIEIENRTLRISGARSDGVRGWRRAFVLPPTVDTARIAADLEDGVLKLTLPKAEEAKPRQITIG